MTIQTYHGSCHCGNGRFTAAFDLSKGTAKCNCTICAKMRLWHVVVDDFALLSDPSLLFEYAWVAAGQREPRIRYYFCKRCAGVIYALGDLGRGKFHAIHVPSLDDLDDDALAAAPLRYEDGLHDRWDRVPADTRLL